MTLVCRALDTFVFGPVYWLREKVVEPLKGESYPWYHRRYPRVPSIDECYTDDLVCRLVALLKILKVLNYFMLLYHLPCPTRYSAAGRRPTPSSSVTGWWRRRSSRC